MLVLVLVGLREGKGVASTGVRIVVVVAVMVREERVGRRDVGLVLMLLLMKLVREGRLRLLLLLLLLLI